MKYNRYKTKWSKKLSIDFINTILGTDKNLDNARIKDLKLIILYYIQGKTAKEIAKDYRVNESAIWRRISKINYKVFNTDEKAK